ncbi:MAG: Hsp20/alpha crystallin family protein, partial [Clostridium sp.]
TVTVKVKSNQLFTNGSNRIVTIIQPNSDIEKKFIVNNVDEAKISAVFESDILRVCLPKKKIETDDEQIIDVENYILE